jgi:UDP-N-acetylglucosamine 2-epimerase (non-hydrolysing)
MKKLLLVAGARPNFTKIAPILRALRGHGRRFQWRLVHTGQHYDEQMSDVFFKELGLPRPNHNLEVGSGTHAEQTARLMLRFEKVCAQEKPQLVLVVGDVNSTLACAIVAKKLQVPVGHVEAGLRSGDRRMPEEINPLVTDSISDYFFVTERSGVRNLLAEGKPRRDIFFVGHVMIDNLFYQLAKLRERPSAGAGSEALKSHYPRYGVVTLHRPSNVDDPKTLGRLLGALGIIAQSLPLIFPVHPRTRANLGRFGFSLPRGLLAVAPQSYMDFLNLFRDAQLVLTDSGGVQEETTALGVPCLPLRDTTERPVAVEEGTNVLVGSSPQRIVAAANSILRGRSKRGRRPRFWDGRAAERIVQILVKRLARE